MNAAPLPRDQIGMLAGKLAAYCGDPSGARSTLQTCLSVLEKSVWPDVAWTFSGLTFDGCPIEFGFSSRSNALRYTLEVGGPEMENGVRLDAACALMARLGHDPAPASLVRQWRQLQSGMPLHWGAWLGIRNAESPGTQETVKLYVEVPDASDWRPPLAWRTPGGPLVMLGFQPSRRRVEYYFRKPRMNCSDFDALLSLLQEPRQRQALRAVFSGLTDLAFDAALRWLTPGYSVAQADGEAGCEIALFVRAQNVRPRCVVRQRMLSEIQRCGGRFSAYGSLFKDMPADRLPDHGMITLAADRNGDIETRVGVSASSVHV